MNKYRAGDICIFSEGIKSRPIVIINNGLGVDLDMTSLRITSQKPRNDFDVEITYWQEAGLDKPSVVRCSKISTIEPGEPMLKIGKLQASDFSNVSCKVKEYIAKGFEDASEV